MKGAMASPPAPPAAARPRVSIVRRLWSFIVFLLVVGALGAAGYTFMQLQRERAAREALERKIADFDPRFEKFKAAVRDVNKQLSSTIFQEVDLGAGGWQPIAGGFYVIDLGVVPQDGGVKITGKIINPTSVTHDAAQLSVRIGASRGSFGLAHLPPGVAQPFDVNVAGVAPADAKRIYMALDSSTISFASSTTRKKTGGDPPDVDKTLK
jgi:hypothetical protein